MSKVGDHNIGAEILLLRKDEMARGQVVAQSHDASGTFMGRAHTNPILDTGMYQVDFAGSEVTDITTNIIAKSIYTQCDADGNEYLLLAVLVDYCEDNKA